MSAGAPHTTDRRGDPWLAWLALGACLAAAAALLLGLQAQLSFFYDEWDFLLGRRDFSVDAFLAPHHEHIAISHVAIYKGLAEAFGIDSPRPFQVVSTLMLISAAAVVFTFLRRRVAWPVAIAAIVPILVLGPAADNVIWPFQLAFNGSIVAGVAALLALERDDRTGDLLACALLIGSLSFSSLGIAFAIGAAVHVALSQRRGARAWIVLVPIALYGIWWLGWGREAVSFLSFKNLATAPSFVFDGFASSIASLVGLGSDGPSGVTALDAGRPLLLIAIAAAGYRLHRLGHVPRGVWVMVAIAVAFWTLTALNANLSRLPTTGRYQLIGAIFVVLVAAELLRGVRFSRTALVVVLAVAAAATASNLDILRQNWISFRTEMEYQRGALSAVEAARDRIDPGFVVELRGGVTIFGDAALYLAAVDDLGSPAFTATELVTAPETARLAADTTFAKAMRVRLMPPRGTPAATGTAPTTILGEGAPAAVDSGCVVLAPDEFGNAVVALAPGGALVRAGSASGVDVTARRYASDFSLELGMVAPGAAAEVAIPTDSSAEPWELRLSNLETATVCGLRP